MAAAVANDGIIMEPHIVDSVDLPVDRNSQSGVTSDNAQTHYEAKPSQGSVVMGPESAYDMRVLMRETVNHGTAHAAFAGLSGRRGFGAFEIGGKTGSLRGGDPGGNNDWFVGYAMSETRRVAVAALTVNIEKWRIKSSVIARTFFESYFVGR